MIRTAALNGVGSPGHLTGRAALRGCDVPQALGDLRATPARELDYERVAVLKLKRGEIQSRRNELSRWFEKVATDRRLSAIRGRSRS
ncbi:MAG TPA: hypothetical protein VE571_00820 [Solirubrobacteraceae bacterium]|nr:hypothetical protein [Solirubrobacteraceae bacterium]